MMLLGTLSDCLECQHNKEKSENKSVLLITLNTGLVSSDVRIKIVSVCFSLPLFFFTLILEPQFFPHLIYKLFFLAKGLCVWLVNWHIFLASSDSNFLSLSYEITHLLTPC